MICPTCQHPRMRTYVTAPADKRDNHRVFRQRKCNSCGATTTTEEMFVHEVRQLERQAAGAGGAGAPSRPLATKDDARALADIEAELEGLLDASLAALKEALTSEDRADRAKVALAQWLVDDRREYRRVLAERAKETGIESSDPAIKQLADILSLVPDEDAA